MQTKPIANPAQHTGVPGFFRAGCREAARGGTRGYKAPGYELARHLVDQAPYTVEPDEWEAELNKLVELLQPTDAKDPGRIPFGLRDDAAVWAWFAEHFPRCAALIPARRRLQFVAGV
jgi:hypothetical protein